MLHFFRPTKGKLVGTAVIAGVLFVAIWAEDYLEALLLQGTSPEYVQMSVETMKPVIEQMPAQEIARISRFWPMLLVLRVCIAVVGGYLGSCLLSLVGRRFIILYE